jgi:hypothetical protein
MHIVYLGVEIDSSSANKHASGDPLDVGMLEEVRRDGPIGSPACEEDHLLATAKVVDDGSS